MGRPSTTPTLMAATCAMMGFSAISPFCMSLWTAITSATYAPVMDAVRVPPSACKTSQSSVMVRSPKRRMSTACRSDRPISR